VSPLEQAFRDALLSLAPEEEFVFGGPRIYTGAELGDSRSYRVPDVFHPESGMIAECDGFYYHEADADRASDDKLRDRVLKKLGHDTVRYSGDQIEADVEACAREYLEFCGITYEEKHMNLPPFLILTKAIFEAPANVDTDFTICTTDPTRSLKRGCVAQGAMVRMVKDIFVDIDERFRYSKTATPPTFGLIEEGHKKYPEASWGRHCIEYSFGGKRYAHVLTQEEHDLVRPFTLPYDELVNELRAVELQNPEDTEELREEARARYGARISKLPDLHLKLYIDPEKDVLIYSGVPITAKNRRGNKPSKPPVKKQPATPTPKVAKQKAALAPSKTTTVSVPASTSAPATAPATAPASSPTDLGTTKTGIPRTRKHITDNAFTKRNRKVNQAREKDMADLDNMAEVVQRMRDSRRK